MKKALIILVLVVMFSWAIYDFTSDSGASEDTETMNQELKSEYESKSEGTEATETISEQDSIQVGLEKGNIAPDFELNTLDGEVTRLSDLRGEKVLLNFWASWCGPCRAEMPDMQKFYEEKDISIVAVNLTDTEIGKGNVSDFVDEYELTFPILLDDEGEVSLLYRIQPIPTTFLINSDGRVHHVAYGALNYEMMVQEFEKME